MEIVWERGEVSASEVRRVPRWTAVGPGIRDIRR
jgi:hypothetical protein